MSQSVSVIIPAYQAELTIRRCVRSALDIGSALREVIVVDDGSTDATASIVREMESLDSRVSCISQENRGRASARNAGFAASRGDWIMFLDADDCLVSADYESFVGAIDEKGLGLAIFMYTKCELSYPGYQDAESAVSTAQYVSSNELFQAMICGGPLSPKLHCGCCLSKRSNAVSYPSCSIRSIISLTAGSGTLSSTSCFVGNVLR